jgi:hypothetical protein
MYCQSNNAQLVMKDKPIKSGMLSICSVIYSTKEFSTSKIKMTIYVITCIMEKIQKLLQRFISLGNDHLSSHEPLPHT